MNNYIVVWTRKGFHEKNVDIINNAKNEQEAVDQVRVTHICADVLFVGLVSKNWV